MNTTKLRALLEAATPRPWDFFNSYGAFPIGADGEPVSVGFDVDDAALIVEMRNSLPALLDRLDKLEAVATAARDYKTAKDEMACTKYEGRDLDRALAALEYPIGDDKP